MNTKSQVSLTYFSRYIGHRVGLVTYNICVQVSNCLVTGEVLEKHV